MRNQTVFNFVAQNVYPVNKKPTAFCCSENKLMVSYESPERCIEVYDLNDCAKLIVSLKPFSHRVEQMLFCKEGNYIATLGKNNESPIVSVIFNWWLREQYFLRRTAGNDLFVEQLSSFSKSPEIVGIPLDEINKLNLRCISCCNSSGNLALCYGLLVTIFRFQKTFFDRQTSKPDFRLILNVRLSFIALKVTMCEDIIAFSSLNHIQVIRLLTETDSTDATRDEDKTSLFSDCIEWNIDTKMSVVRFPSLCCESADESVGLLSHYPEMIGPISDTLCCKIKTGSFIGNNKSTKVKAEVLLCRYVYENEGFQSESDVIDVCLIPVYKASQNISNDPLKEVLPYDDFSTSNSFTSKMYSHLLNCGCFVSTKYYGYFYSLKDNVEKVHRFCYEDIAKAVIVEENVVHVLTEKSLKTYSLSLLNSTFGLMSNTIPLLLNSRLFLGTEQLYSCSGHVLLICKNLSENNSYTVYSLEKPSFEELFKDFNEVLNQKVLEIEDQIQLLHFFLVYLKYMEVTSVHRCNEHQKRCLSVCFSLAAILQQFSNDATPQSIVEYVFKSVDVDIKALLSFEHEYKNEFIGDVIRYKMQKNFDVTSFDSKTIIQVLPFVCSDDIKTIVFKYTFNHEEKESILSFLRDFNHNEQQLMKAKVDFDCGKVEDVEKRLFNEDIHLVESLLANKNYFLPLTPFAIFIAKMKSKQFLQFCISCLKRDYFSVERLAELLVESENILVTFLDSLFCDLRLNLNSNLVVKLTDAYITAIFKESNKFKFYGKLAQKSAFIQLLLPLHENSKMCLCNQCSPEFEKLIYLLHFTRCAHHDEAIANVSSFLTTSEDKCLKILHIFTSKSYNEALELINEINSDAVILFTLDSRNTFKEKWKAVWEAVIEKNFTPADNEHPVVQEVFRNLSESLTPREFMNLIPQKWVLIAKPYFKKCLEKHESLALKDKIVNLGNELKTMISFS